MLLRALAWPIDHPRTAWAILAAAVLAALAALPSARFDPSPERLFPEDGPRMVLATEHRALFGRDDDLLLLVHDGDPFGEAVARVANAARAIPGVGSVVTPSDLPFLASTPEGVEVRTLQPGDPVPQTARALVPDAHTAVVAVRLVGAAADEARERGAAVAALRAIAPEWHVAGVPALRVDYLIGVGRDLGRVLPLSLLLAGFLLYRTFRDWRHALLCSVAVGCGAVLAAGGWAASGTPFGLLAPAFLTVVIVVGTADLVHLVHRFADHCAEVDPDTAARRAVAELGPACALTSGTTALGFLALMWTEIAPVRAFGLGTGLGVLGTFGIAFLLVPPVLARLGPPVSGAHGHLNAAADRLSRLGTWVLPRWRGLLAVWGVAIVLMLPAALSARADSQILPRLVGTEGGAQHVWVQDRLGGALPLSVDITTDRPDTDPEVLAALDAIVGWLREQPTVGHAVAFSDVVGEGWRALGGEGQLPSTPAGVAQTLLVLEGGHDPRTGFVAVDPQGRTRHRITASVADAGTDALTGLLDGLARQSERHLTGLGTARPTGVTVRVEEVNAILVAQFGGSFLLALGVIGAVWWLGSRSWRRTLVAVVANTVPLLAVAAMLGALGVPLDPTVAMVFPIGLGIAVDDSIHFLAAYERARARMADVDSALHHAWATAGRSMVDTTVMVGVGFAMLAIAVAPDLRAFGLVTAAGIAAALACDLLLLPALVRGLEGDR
ncbi:MAG: putative RND superfamily exporter protein [Myxococcota bacterium]|jgi:predicted RND superfamily exporter protein